MNRPKALLIEDEAMVAMMMEQVLDDLGWEVIGAFSDVETALNWLRDNGPVDAGVLDINLGTEMVFPVANALKNSGTPFTFLTGYTAPPEAFNFETPVLSKPVDIDQLEDVLNRFRPAA